MTRRLAMLGVLLAMALPASAIMDDAQSFALEAATPWVAKGVELRQDYARGTLPPGGLAKVSYQVFAGMEYWFFVGGSESGMVMDVSVTGPDGKAVEGRKTPGNNAVTFHFTARRTMLVTIEVTGRPRLPVAFDWAVVYGFRPRGSAEDS